jgi:1-acyl-sn-glycerol-3-phosphate acyltransferase
MAAVHPNESLALRLQALLGWGVFPLVGPGAVLAMRVARRHRIEGIAEARRVYKEALATGRPTIVCANHLTMVDSAFLHHGLASIADYLRDYRLFSWNVPTTDHIADKPLLRALVYLSKCVTLDRSAEPEERKQVIERIKHLVARGEIVTLFPEGGRSRTGRVDVENVTYGVGEILRDLDRPQVVCVYLRGDRQDTYSTVPAFGDTLRLRVEVLEPRTSFTGLRASRDLARQVIAKLKAMEDAILMPGGIKNVDFGREVRDAAP